MIKKEKLELKEKEYFEKMLDFVKEDIEEKRHKLASYHSAFQGRMSKERFDELLKEYHLIYDFDW